MNIIYNKNWITLWLYKIGAIKFTRLIGGQIRDSGGLILLPYLHIFVWLFLFIMSRTMIRYLKHNDGEDSQPSSPPSLTLQSSFHRESNESVADESSTPASFIIQDPSRQNNSDSCHRPNSQTEDSNLIIDLTDSPPGSPRTVPNPQSPPIFQRCVSIETDSLSTNLLQSNSPPTSENLFSERLSKFLRHNYYRAQKDGSRFPKTVQDLRWTSNESWNPSETMKNDVMLFLHTISGGNKQVFDVLFPTHHIDRMMSDNIRQTFLSCVPGNGRMKLNEKRRHVTILSALMTGEKCQDRKIALRSGYPVRSMIVRQASELKKSILLEENKNTEATDLIDNAISPKTRSDCWTEYSKKVIADYCHDDKNGHRLDSNESRPQHIGDGVYHCRRVWENITTWQEKYNNFKRSKQYVKFKSDNVGKDICMTTFRTYCCPCLGNAKHESCVDLIMSQLEEYMIAIRCALRSRPILHEEILACNCVHHCNREPELVRYAPPSSLSSGCNTKQRPINKKIVNRCTSSVERICFGHTPREVVERSCCESIRHPDLAVGLGSSMFIPSFIPWLCVYDDGNENNKGGACVCCGVQNMLPDAKTCPTYRRNTVIKFSVMVWRKEKIKNSRQSQWEMKECQQTFGELVDGLCDAIVKARRHYVTYRWSDHVITRLKECVDPSCAQTICTDFSAGMNLRARCTDNCSVDSHAVLQVFQSFSDQRAVPFTRHDGSQDLHLLTNCEVDQFIGGTESKGKSNDHQFHTACLLALLRRKEKHRVPTYDHNGKRKPYTYFIVTDNCTGQYKCRHNFIFLASICSHEFKENNIRFEHVFASKYRFKGTWDGEGKVTKLMIRHNELKGIGASDTLSAFLSARNTCTINNTDNNEVERIVTSESQQITQFQTCSVNKRTFWLVCTSPESVTDAVAKGVKKEEIVLINREHKLSATEPVPGTKTLDQVRVYPMKNVKENRYKVYSSTLSCACPLCLKGHFKHCDYLATRGNVSSHYLTKTGKGNWE